MVFDLLADVVVVVHAAFLAFVVVGPLLLPSRPGVAWFHLPALVWGAGSIVMGIECPLTAIEKALRSAAGEAPYAGGFVDRYIEDVAYPEELTPVLWALAAAIAVVKYTSLRGHESRPTSM
jgi:hypothetical protein